MSAINAHLDGEWRRSSRTFALALAVFGTVALLQAGGALQSLERKTLDARFQYLNRPAAVDSSIVLAAIDGSSFSFARNRMKVGWPWPREYYGTLVDYLHEGGAKAVVFNILFPKSDIPRANVNSKKSDENFAQAMKNAGNVALAMQLTAADTTQNPLNSKHTLDQKLPSSFLVPSYNAGLAPIPSFQGRAAALGGANIRGDEDGVVRHLPLAYRLADSITVPNLGLAALRAGRAEESEASLLSELPTGPTGSFLLYWYGPGGYEGAFRDQYISIKSLIVSAAQLKLGQEPQVPPSRFKDKTVIVGIAASKLSDQYSTPVGTKDLEEASYPGMEIFATFLSNIQQGHFLRDFLGVWLYLLVLMMTVTGACLALVRPDFISRSFWLLISAGTVGVYLGAAVAAFYYLLWWVPVVAPTLALVGGVTAPLVNDYLEERRRREEFRSFLRQSLSPQVIDKMVENPDALGFEGEEVEGTAFFSDIEDFTSTAEELSPREVVEDLNEYFGVATEVILDHHAMVDKFLGDGIMAVFGAPVRRSDHAEQACLAALKMNRVLEEFYRASEDTEHPPFESRVGVHTGRFVLGNVGTESRADYTAIGDTVNVAARLEQANKLYGTRILISEATYQDAQDVIEARELDLLRVTGKEEAIPVYEVLAPADELSDLQEELRGRFEEGLIAYQAGSWEQARQAFSDVLRKDPNDGPSTLYLERIEERMEESLPSNWRGVHEMTVGK